MGEVGSDESEGGYGLGIWIRNRIREAGHSGRKRSEELGIRTITVHFDMAGTGVASLIKLAHRGDPGCLLALVLSNRLVVSAYLDLVSAAGGEGQRSQKCYWLEGWSECGGVSRRASTLHGWEWSQYKWKRISSIQAPFCSPGLCSRLTSLLAVMRWDLVFNCGVSESNICKVFFL